MKLDRPQAVKFDERGLVTAVVQDSRTGTVLMVANMDREALELTLATGQVHFWSRSRKRLWRKGETSGAILEVDGVQADCDGDCLLVAARPMGPTCHLGRRSCFGEPAILLDQLQQTLESRRQSAPPGSYTAELFAAGEPGISRKIGEEAVEVILAAHQPDQGQLVAEVADLWFHAMVLLAARGLSPTDVFAELKRRQAP